MAVQPFLSINEEVKCNNGYTDIQIDMILVWPPLMADCEVVLLFKITGGTFLFYITPLQIYHAAKLSEIKVNEKGGLLRLLQGTISYKQVTSVGLLIPLFWFYLCMLFY